MRVILPVLVLTVTVASGPARAERMITLKQAYRMALHSHPSIRMLKERVRQAEAARYRAWSALKPTAGFQGTFTHYDKEIVIDFGEFMKLIDPNAKSDPTVIQKQDQFGFAATASLPLFRGPAYPGIGMARKQVELAKLTEIRSRQDFLLQVARAYYMVVSQKEVARATKHKVEVDEKHLAAAKARFQVGQSPRSEALRADLVATQDRQRLRVERNRLKAARLQLGILLGVKDAVDVKRPPEPRSPDASGSGVVPSALEAREDYRAAQVGQSLAAQAKETVWWGFLPSLDLSWLYRWSEAAGFAGEKGNWQLMLTLNLPIYDGGVRYANLRETSAKLREAAEQRRALELKIEGEIVQLSTEVDSANAGVISAHKALELAKTTASDMEVSFEAGAVTQLDVLDANQRLLDAELGLTSALFQRDLARLALAHALGRFHPADKAR